MDDESIIPDHIKTIKDTSKTMTKKTFHLIARKEIVVFQPQSSNFVQFQQNLNIPAKLRQIQN